MSRSLAMNRDVECLHRRFPRAEKAYIEHVLSMYHHDRLGRAGRKLERQGYPLQETSTNEVLLQLNEIWPLATASALRSAIVMFPFDRPRQTTEYLLTHPPSGKRQRPRGAFGRLEPWEMFRSEQYTMATKYLLYKDFKMLYRSTIRAVMAENNSDYARSYKSLKDLEQKSWWPWSWPLRWNLSFKNDDLHGISCNELEDEVRRLRPSHELADEQMARNVNYDEYKNGHALLDCQVCYGSFAWEDLVACTKGHFVCRSCVERYVKEGIFGQGGLRAKTAVRCLSSEEECSAIIPYALVERSVSAELRAAWRDTCVDTIQWSGLDLVQCPFCYYAEFKPSVKRRTSLLFVLLFTPLLPIILLIYLTRFILGQYLATEVEQPRQEMFRCRNSECGIACCLLCREEFLPFHRCHADKKDGMRRYMEAAMADAVKRTCPQCKLSFIKADGCNKLICPCGYVMCYVCRRDIRDEGYKHFCEHFRQQPGQPCDECTKCDLYKVETDVVAIERAAKRAQEEYISISEGWK